MANPSPALPTRALFLQLLSDATVLPPAELPLDEAVARRAARRGTPASDFVGPLLVAPADVPAALEEPGGLVLTVTGAAGASGPEVVRAASQVADSPTHALAGIVVTAQDDWHGAIDLAVPIAVQVPAGSEGLALLPELAAPEQEVIAAIDLSAAATGDLAAFLNSCAELELAFQLAGGPEDAVSTDGRTGYLNVLLATDAALHGGDTEQLLETSDEDAVRSALLTFSEAAAVTVRNTFESFAASDVRAVVSELQRLGLA